MPWFRPWIEADEFVNAFQRYCLWLGETPPVEIRKMPEVMKIVEAVRNFRKSSKSLPTRKLALTPTRFHVENRPDGPFMVIPEVSTERRNYIPMGFVKARTLASNLVFVIPQPTMYHFGMLSSSIHNFWTRAVCGRLVNGYRYSKDIVYNNFPWPKPTESQKEVIEKAAQNVLVIRDQYPGQCLADLYDPLTMPPALLQAHQELDRVVGRAYGFSANDLSEENCVSLLMDLYQKLLHPSEKPLSSGELAYPSWS